MNVCSKLLLGATMVIAQNLAIAQVTIGVLLSSTGPAASLGTLEKNGVVTAASLSKGKYKIIYLDDASDPSEATRLARKLITEEKVDVIIGTTSTPAALAMVNVIAEGKTPTISMVPNNALVAPPDGPRRWMFKTSTNDDHEVRPLFDHMKAHSVHKLGFIGFADAYGEQWLHLSKQIGLESQVELVAEERFARTDSSVTGQVLKIVSKAPDAVLIAGSGGAAATPLLELRKRGYKGKIYVTLGATFGEFLKLSGAEADGVFAPFAAVMGVSQLAEGDPMKAGAADFVQAYEEKFGANTGNIFSGGAWDAVKLLDVAVPVASKSASPGTIEFREALRSAIENIKGLSAARGVYSLSTMDHTGLDARSLRVGRYEKGHWLLEQ